MDDEWIAPGIFKKTNPEEIIDHFDNPYWEGWKFKNNLLVDYDTDTQAGPVIDIARLNDGILIAPDQVGKFTFEIGINSSYAHATDAHRQENNSARGTLNPTYPSDFAAWEQKVLVTGYSGPSHTASLSTTSTNLVDEELVLIQDLHPTGSFLRLNINNNTVGDASSIQTITANCYTIGQPLDKEGAVAVFIHPLSHGETYQCEFRYTYANGKVKRFIAKGHVFKNEKISIGLYNTDPNWSDGTSVEESIPSVNAASVALVGKETVDLQMYVTGVDNGPADSYGRRTNTGHVYSNVTGGTLLHDNLNITKTPTSNTLLVSGTLFVPDESSTTWSVNARYRFGTDYFDVVHSGTWDPDYGIRVLDEKGSTRLDDSRDFLRIIEKGEASNTHGEKRNYTQLFATVLSEENITESNEDTFMPTQTARLSKRKWHSTSYSGNYLNWSAPPTGSTYWTGSTGDVFFFRDAIIGGGNGFASYQDGFKLKNTNDGATLDTYRVVGYHNGTDGPFTSDAVNTSWGNNMGWVNGGIAMENTPLGTIGDMRTNFYYDGLASIQRKIGCCLAFGGTQSSSIDSARFIVLALEESGTSVPNVSGIFYQINFLGQILRRQDATYFTGYNGHSMWVWDGGTSGFNTTGFATAAASDSYMDYSFTQQMLEIHKGTSAQQYQTHPMNNRVDTQLFKV